MTTYQVEVRQHVTYQLEVEADTPEDVVKQIEAGEWDEGNSNVTWDQVRVFEERGACVLDTEDLG